MIPATPASVIQSAINMPARYHILRSRLRMPDQNCTSRFPQFPLLGVPAVRAGS